MSISSPIVTTLYSSGENPANNSASNNHHLIELRVHKAQKLLRRVSTYICLRKRFDQLPLIVPLFTHFASSIITVSLHDS